MGEGGGERGSEEGRERGREKKVLERYAPAYLCLIDRSTRSRSGSEVGRMDRSTRREGGRMDRSTRSRSLRPQPQPHFYTHTQTQPHTNLIVQAGAKRVYADM